jgi:hypothetical protein
MADIQITISVPEQLLSRLKDAGLTIDSITPDLIAVLERRLERKAAWQNLIDSASQLQGSLTQEEIDAELGAAKADRIAKSDQH